MEAQVAVRTVDGALVTEAVAQGNTPLAARAAGHACGRILALEASLEHDQPMRYSVQVGAVSEMREVQA